MDEYTILDTPREGAFEAEAFDLPLAVISGSFT